MKPFFPIPATCKLPAPRRQCLPISMSLIGCISKSYFAVNFGWAFLRLLSLLDLKLGNQTSIFLGIHTYICILCFISYHMIIFIFTVYITYYREYSLERHEHSLVKHYSDLPHKRPPQFARKSKHGGHPSSDGKVTDQSLVMGPQLYKDYNKPYIHRIHGTGILPTFGWFLW